MTVGIKAFVVNSEYSSYIFHTFHTRVGQSAVTEEGTIVNKPQSHGGHTNPAFLSDQTVTDKGEHLHFQTMSEDAENAASDILGELVHRRSCEMPNQNVKVLIFL